MLFLIPQAYLEIVVSSSSSKLYLQISKISFFVLHLDVLQLSHISFFPPLSNFAILIISMNLFHTRAEIPLAAERQKRMLLKLQKNHTVFPLDFSSHVESEKSKYKWMRRTKIYFNYFVIADKIVTVFFHTNDYFPVNSS